ncbi:hypothetical protein [Amycolatopsis sp. VC5-11]|uniref:hypothetical protein n=1 Tax=Amycolatopsis sp. VC5-11 TaxID=3120156 RepID=UPI00300A7E18
MRITFHHASRGESVARVRRGDGVTLVLPSYSRKWRVPHDLAHAAAERELRLGGGVFGCIAAGAVFDNMRVTEGKPRHDAKARSAKILRSAKRSIGIAEVMAGVIHEAVEQRLPIPFEQAREGWGALAQDPFPWTDADITRATDTLRELDRQWQASPNPLEFDWPDSLRADR